MQDTPLRHYNLQGASNFRDLGGYATADGRSVRWRHIFRSNHLGHLTRRPTSASCANSASSRRSIFAAREERVAAACVVKEIAVHSLPIEPTVVAALRARLQAARLIVRRCTRDHARTLIAAMSASTPTVFASCSRISRWRGRPLVIHCTAGKDRTGFACALILHALGVPEKVSPKIIS